MSFSTEPIPVCPHVRMTFDERTAFSFPSPHNQCFVPEKPKTIELEHQESHCLCEHYVQCPVYRRSDLARSYHGKIDFLITNLNGVGAPIPTAVMQAWQTVAQKTQSPYFYMVVFMMVLAMVGVLVQFALA